MSVFKCKMCGGTIEFQPGDTVGVCDSCGTRQTLPRLSDERRAAMYDRANHFRRNNEYDKASGLYEQILNEDSTDAEAYWSLVLCRYGIEYVEDPATGRRVPTMNRTQYTSIFDDEDYRSALANADPAQRHLYEAEANTINGIQRKILEISQREQPFDVFISFKETDANGRRTRDAVLAQELYGELVKEGFKVFFAPITLEDKLGTEYEPYIFAALNSARVMVVMGTRPEHFQAVWVRNEWSRYLALIRGGAEKTLIPAYRDMDPYDLPDEFSHLMAQNMSKLGFMQDLIRGIRKLIPSVVPQTQTKMKETEPTANTEVVPKGSISSLLGRGFIALEDQEWDKADEYFEQVLNQDFQNAEAYLGKFLIREHQSSWESYCLEQQLHYTAATTERLEACPEDTQHVAQSVKQHSLPGYLTETTIRDLYKFDRYYDSALSCRKNQKIRQERELQNDRLLARIRRYAKADLKQQIDDGISKISGVLDERISKAQSEDNANIARIQSAYKAHLAEADKITVGKYEAARTRRENQYQAAASAMQSAETIPAYESAIQLLEAMNGYKDTSTLADQCRSEIARLQEEYRLAAEAYRLAAKENIRKAKLEIKALNEDIHKCEGQIAGLGLFKGKEKKQFQEQLAVMRERLKAARQQLVELREQTASDKRLPRQDRICAFFDVEAFSQGQKVKFGHYMQGQRLKQVRI